jgi:hypothetical protein
MTTSDWVRGEPAGWLRGGTADWLSGGAAGWIRGGATALAAARTAIGVVALAAPTLVTRPWLGPDHGPAARVLGRALGGRDLALGLGALAALQRPPTGPRSAGHPGIWIGVGALSDAMDVLATVAAWDELPRVGRWLVAMSAGGAAVAGAAAAGSLLTEATASPPAAAAASAPGTAAGSPPAEAAADGA